MAAKKPVKGAAKKKAVVAPKKNVVVARKKAATTKKTAVGPRKKTAAASPKKAAPPSKATTAARKKAAVAAKRGSVDGAKKSAGATKAAAAKPTRSGLKPSPPERHERSRAAAPTAKAVKAHGKTPARAPSPAAATAAAPPRRRPMRAARDIYSPATGTNSSEPVSGKELEKFRQLILDLRNESIEELEMLTEQLREMTASEVGEDNNAYSLHMAEQGTDAMEREKTFLQAQRTSDYVKKLGEALERIDNGSFGLCRVCGLRLDSKRLMAVPVTQVCTVYKNTSKPCEPGRLHMQELGITEEDSAG